MRCPLLPSQIHFFVMSGQELICILTRERLLLRRSIPLFAFLSIISANHAAFMLFETPFLFGISVRPLENERT